MNYYLLIYVLLCIVIGLGGTAFLAQMNRGIGAVAFLIGSILVFVFFGLRWFEYGNKFATTTWPPVINSCPDYLVYTTRTKGIGSDAKTIGACVDPLGISRGAITRWTYGDNPPTGKDAPGDEFYFDLDFGKTDPIELATARCERVKAKGVTWDGVGDGDSCYKQTALAAAVNAAAAKCASGTL